MLRSILVGLDGSPWSEAATTLAVEWGVRFGARLLGLGVVDEPSIDRAEAVPMGAYAFKKRLTETRLADAHHRVLQFLEEFRARSVSAGVAATVLEDIGDPAERILREAQRCDVVILGRETHFHFETQEQPDAILGQVLRVSPRPVVVVPRELAEGHGVVVAYGGGREGARTLQTFESLGLAGGEEVQVVTVHRDRSRGGGHRRARRRVPRRPRHASPAEPPSPPRPDAAEVLVEEVRRRRPRLLVIGAHGHHPLRDLFATSVTRAVLQECAVPTFIGS